MRKALTLLLLLGLAAWGCGDKTPPGDADQPATSMLDGVGRAARVQAQSYGDNARMAQQAYHAAHGRYAASLAELATIDDGLTADPKIGFVFGGCNEAGFTFTVISHNNEQLTFTD